MKIKTSDESFFAEEFNPRLEARALTQEAMCRLLLWQADAPTLEDRGLRTSVALYCIRPDLIEKWTDVGVAQRWHKLFPF